jgi:DNA repair exonuclease SbcCD ATPase subunit
MPEGQGPNRLAATAGHAGSKRREAVVIEFGLLFGLGFLTAVVAALLAAPAIHRRVVAYTENRIMTTLPINRQELRAQKDMVRAELAAAMARTSHDLRVEREKLTAATLSRDEIAAEAARLHGQNHDLAQTIEAMKVEAAEMRAELRHEELALIRAKEALAKSEHGVQMTRTRLDELLHKSHRLGVEVDNLKIELATRDTEIEGLKLRLNGLRDERETLRDDLKTMTMRAKDAELRLAREENKARRLEEKLNAEVSTSVDKDTVLERRMGEIAKLRNRLKQSGEDVPVALPFVERTILIDKTDRRAKTALSTENAATSGLGKRQRLAVRVIDARAAADLVETVKASSAQVSEALMTLPPSGDEAMREEIAGIAAKMIAIVGQAEGADSPVRSILTPTPAPNEHGRMSLGNRARSELYPER